MNLHEIYIYAEISFFNESIRFFLPKVMASHESNEDSVKSPVMDEVNTLEQSKTDEKKSTTASLLVDRPNDTADNAKEKISISATTDDCTNVEKNDSDNIKSENKDNVKPMIIDKNEGDNKMDEKQETQDLVSLTDPQNIENEEKEVKSEDGKDSSTKGGSALKRKRKTVKLVQTCF